MIELYHSTDENLDTDRFVEVLSDGMRRKVSPGGKVVLKPGESITLPPYLYHRFWGQSRTVLVGEVSSVNDDQGDNRFYERAGRFPEIDEDERPLYLLCGDDGRFI